MSVTWYLALGVLGLFMCVGGILSAIHARGRANPQPRTAQDRERALVARQLARQAGGRRRAR
jgi:hypothetical protein